jgi:D-glycero-D-manno-heptose 1,7-bisphosphate phosphatase
MIGQRRLLLLDRDGVILRHVDPYVLRESDVEFVPGSCDALRLAAAAGFHLAVVTNQSPLQRGLVTLDFVERTNDRIAEVCGFSPDMFTVYVCPHTAAAGCACRKPRPGMLLQAMRDLGVPPARSVMVGDHETDMLAARSAGVSTALHVLSGRQRDPSPVADGVFADLAGAVHWLIDPGSAAHPRTRKRQTRERHDPSDCGQSSPDHQWTSDLPRRGG